MRSERQESYTFSTDPSSPSRRTFVLWLRVPHAAAVALRVPGPADGGSGLPASAWLDLVVICSGWKPKLASWEMTCFGCQPQLEPWQSCCLAVSEPETYEYTLDKTYDTASTNNHTIFFHHKQNRNQIQKTRKTCLVKRKKKKEEKRKEKKREE